MPACKFEKTLLWWTDFHGIYYWCPSLAIYFSNL